MFSHFFPPWAQKNFPFFPSFYRQSHSQGPNTQCIMKYKSSVVRGRKFLESVTLRGVNERGSLGIPSMKKRGGGELRRKTRERRSRLRKAEEWDKKRPDERLGRQLLGVRNFRTFSSWHTYVLCGDFMTARKHLSIRAPNTRYV